MASSDRPPSGNPPSPDRGSDPAYQSTTPDDVHQWLGRIGVGAWTWDPLENTVHWDEAAEAVYGLPPGGFSGTFEGYIELVHPEDRDEVVELIGSVAAAGGDYSIRHRVIWPNGEVHWVEGQGRMTLDESGRIVDGRGIVYRLSDRYTFDRERADLVADQQVALAEAAANRERLRFLIDVTDAIGASLNAERVARQAIAVICGRLGSRAYVEVELQEPFGHVLVCAGDTSGSQVVVSGPMADHPSMVRRRETIVTPMIGEDIGVDRGGILDLDSSQLSSLVDVERGFPLAVPVTAHGTRLGTLVAFRDDRDWTSDSIDMLAAAGRRAGSAFHRAQLHADRAKFVSMFQAAATPRDLPVVPGLDVAVHYRPATELVRLGGDLYDIFELPDGSWILAVGDVCGKGIVAAGHAELTRSALRAAALAASGPAGALDALNRALLAEHTRPMVTVAIARAHAMGGRTRLTVSTAGHPPPIAVTGRDEWRPVDVRGTMLGVTPDAHFEETDVLLEPGDALAMYTDGVTESRFGSEFFGLERLGKVLSTAWPASARSLVLSAGSQVETWSAASPSDDVLLLVARAGDA